MKGPSKGLGGPLFCTATWPDCHAREFIFAGPRSSRTRRKRAWVAPISFSRLTLKWSWRHSKEFRCTRTEPRPTMRPPNRRCPRFPHRSTDFSPRPFFRRRQGQRPALSCRASGDETHPRSLPFQSCAGFFGTLVTMLLPPSAILREIFSEKAVLNDRGEKVELQSNVSAHETALLHAAVRELRPGASVEVGFAQGISTLAILDAIKVNGAGHHHVIDPFQKHYGNAGCAMVARAALNSHYSFHERHADEVIPALPPLQFAFIDSSHLFDLTLCEFVLVDRKLDVGGVIGFHDLWMPSQQAVIRYILANRAFEAWQPSCWPAVHKVGDSRMKKLVRSALGSSRPGQRIFSREFLHPWRDFKLDNLVLLKKRAHDNRDWRFHRPF
jgi:predicted O-methyltransferase YrrM